MSENNSNSIESLEFESIEDYKDKVPTFREFKNVGIKKID